MRGKPENDFISGVVIQNVCIYATNLIRGKMITHVYFTPSLLLRNINAQLLLLCVSIKYYFSLSNVYYYFILMYYITQILVLKFFPSLSTKYLSISLREGAAESAKFDDMCVLYVLLLCKNGYWVGQSQFVPICVVL